MKKSTEWERLYINYTYDRGLVFRMYKKLKTLSIDLLYVETITNNPKKKTYKLLREVFESVHHP